ncbi:MAG TPA: hypothetical protein DCZ95_02820 [Verrucomicrobia bacterium]|nr:MAG: hypothetical protein A2X46_14885 [Lentisphaerae bacterium GWF2_57_35]HBA83005.1 hypothetical protein [Verrucomicrobiota bacterium]
MRYVKKMLSDDSAQALVEFALVIPFLLLLLFALIQSLLIAQAAQLGNYAAYAAARVYAVRSGVAGLDGDAEEYAKKAAALVYAPVSKLMLNEAAALPGGVDGLLSGGFPDFVDNAAEIGEGFLTAYYIRLSSAGGGDFRVSRSGSPEQVKVELDFAYPIFLPGLAEAWSLVAGERNMKTHLQDMNVASDSAAADLASPYPYVIVKSKCTMGYEPWSGTPRQGKTVSSDAATDPSLAQHIQDIEAAKQALDAAVAAEKAAYDQWVIAQNNLAAAQAAYDADPSPANLAALNAAKDAEEAAHNNYLAKKAEREQREEEYEDLIGM